MRRYRAALLATCVSGLLLASGAALANAPEPGWACQGKEAGDPCKKHMSGRGPCVLMDEACVEPPDAQPQQCLECVPNCAISETPGAGTAGFGVLAVVGALLGLVSLRRRT